MEKLLQTNRIFGWSVAKLANDMRRRKITETTIYTVYCCQHYINLYSPTSGSKENKTYIHINTLMLKKEKSPGILNAFVGAF